MFSLGPLETVIVIGLLYVALRGWIRRRRPTLVKKINIALFASLAAVMIYRLVIFLRRR